MEETLKDYPGDSIETCVPIKESGFQKLDFADPAELICFFDDTLSSGQITLHKWQTELLESFAAVKPTSLKPHKFCLVAANGSGKDAFVIAPFTIWFALTKIQSRVIITSSSGVQLTSQTENYIRALAEKVNKFFGGQEYFRIRQRYIKCRLTGSEIRMFATDEAGKAEGYHPMVPNAEMAIIINEWKSVDEDIHKALKRCTGYNYWIGVSTPGEPKGSLYKARTTWQHIDLKDIHSINTSGTYSSRVTSYDCPHLSLEDIEEDKREDGEHSAFFRSKHLALFTSIGGEVIIPLELLEKLLSNPPRNSILGWPIRIGIDLAAGGDENVICFLQGNRCIKEICWRETDTTITADRIERELNEMKIEKTHKHIYADDGGVGHSVIDMLVRRGWDIKRILNQWAAVNKRQFGNKGAENWYRCKRFFEEGLLDIKSVSEKTRNQLSNRHYKQQLTGARIYLESKKEAKANGRPSPDRADALILSLTGLTLKDFLEAKTIETSNVKFKEGETLLKTNEELTRYYEDSVTYGDLDNAGGSRKSMGRRIFNSLRAAIKG